MLDTVRKSIGRQLTLIALKSKESPSQTAGPYVHIGCVPTFAGLEGMFGGVDLGSRMINKNTQGERITITGQVIDGIGAPLKDGIVEIWQADHAGLFNCSRESRGRADPHFMGWGRQPTDRDNGSFTFETIRPGQVPYSDGRLQAPHIQFWIAARGINLGLHTRMYFGDEERANQDDPVLSLIGDEHRVQTLIAAKTPQGFQFKIHLQGDQETVFFDI